MMGRHAYRNQSFRAGNKQALQYLLELAYVVLDNRVHDELLQEKGVARRAIAINLDFGTTHDSI